jgi:hypothetical protein
MPLVDRRRTGEDRRKTRRIPAVFAVQNGRGREVQLGQAEDIGPAGMTLRFPRDTPLAADAAVILVFELPGTRGAIAARAQVVSERRSGRYRRTGVRFTAVDPQSASLIEAYCQSGAAR